MISAVIITKNEEANIERCIRSMKHVADEVLILDSGSTDRTAEIAESLSARVEQVKWEGYAKTKNYGNSIASFDYILSIDADEEISKELEVSIMREIRRGLKGAYRFDRRNFYGNRWIRTCGWYPDQKIRLFNRNDAHWEGDYVHETLVLRPEVSIMEFKGALNHYSIKNRDHHVETVQKYAGLAAHRLLAQGKTPSKIKGVLSAITAFFQKFILKKGFMDGILGFSIAWQSARSKWLRQAIAAREISTKKADE